MRDTSKPLAPCDSVHRGFLGAMNYKQQALLLMEFQQDAFLQEYGHTMPTNVCKRKVTDFVIRQYKRIDELCRKQLATDVDLNNAEGLFWAVIQLQEEEI